MSFDWQTEDHDWTDAERAAKLASRPEDDSPPIAPARPRRRWRFVLAAVLLLAAVVAVVAWQVTRRAEATQARLTAEIIASHQLLEEAAAEDDAELFVSFLSGRDPAWTQAHEALVRRGGFRDRSAFGLSQMVGIPVTPTVTLAPDLLSAELVALQPYILSIGNGLTETVVLERPLVFRQGQDRWLLAPPDDAFWGETSATGSRYVRVTYPARDADIAERLARDLDAALANFCRYLDDVCAGNVRLDLTLSTDPASLVEYTEMGAMWRGGSEIVMPTPTLFGRPQDEAGYRALARVYAARVVSAAAANYAGWQCCGSHMVFYGALLDALLDRLGLQPWPLTTADYAQLPPTPDLTPIADAWAEADAPPLQRRAVYALVEFLANRDGAPTIPDMQRLLLDGIDPDFTGWLRAVASNAYATPDDLAVDFARFVAARAEPPAAAGE